MKKTFITKMPDEAGAFLEASRIISSVGANITRVSYNKAVDTHTLFIDVEGSKNQLEHIAQGLAGIGYPAARPLVQEAGPQLGEAAHHVGLREYIQRGAVLTGQLGGVATIKIQLIVLDLTNHVIGSFHAVDVLAIYKANFVPNHQKAGGSPVSGENSPLGEKAKNIKSGYPEKFQERQSVFSNSGSG